ncbi:MAG TPA: chorismate-binding protein, partial [Gammaproteobacteria bacterium]|nr:chorismate-binding protein [Gammaproteobacteria bacterium]
MESPFDIAADLDTPVSAWLKLQSFKPRFLLESVEGGERLARYSFLGLGEAVKLIVEPDRVVLNGVAQRSPADAEGWLTLMRRALELAPELTPLIDGNPFAGGLVGATGYDTVRYFEKIPAHRAALPGLPLAAYVAPVSMLVFDHLTRRVALLHAGSESERAALRREIIAALRGAVSVPRSGSVLTPATPSITEAQFLDAVDNAKRHIAAGDIYQIVLAVRFAGTTDIHPFETYRGLRLLNPSPYMYFVEIDSLHVAGSSPEALVRLDHGHASLRPIAGTRPRGATPGLDASLERELLADPKENAEHVMLVDLARNDL